MAEYTLHVDDALVNGAGQEFTRSVIDYKLNEAIVLITKQGDYGPNNIALCPIGPVNGLIVRLYDKISRLTNLTRTGAAPNHESIVDTGLDIANYGTIVSMILAGHWPKPPGTDL